MKLSNLQILLRVVIDLGTVLSLVVAAIVVSWLCSFDGPLEIANRYEHVIWAFSVIVIATCRAYCEYLWRVSLDMWSRIVLWILIVIVTYLLLCWLDTHFNSHDTFVNVFAFGLFVFLAPSLLVSTALYVAMSDAIERKNESDLNV